MQGVLAAEAAVLLEFDTVGIVFLVFLGVVVSLLAVHTGQRDADPCSCCCHFVGTSNSYNCLPVAEKSTIKKDLLRRYKYYNTGKIKGQVKNIKEKLLHTVEVQTLQTRFHKRCFCFFSILFWYVIVTGEREERIWQKPGNISAWITMRPSR